MMRHVVAFLWSLRWQDMVDILLNSYLLFRLYILFRGTQVFRVAVGMGLLWLFQRFASLLDLIVTSWVAQGVAALAALIVIVVFRNEIRSVFQVKNLGLLLWGRPRRALLAPLGILAETVFDMARARVGALLVFPGKEDLRDLTHSGIPWQGLVSKEMLWSIFNTAGPVHDGAVIVRGDRIDEVGCVLPLTRRKDLPPFFGTRHRAGVGLAEVSDALVLIVSEERGEVTAARGQQVLRVRDAKGLSRLMEDHFGPKEREKRWAGEEMKLAVAAAACLFIVAGVWFGVARGLETFVAFDVPIEYVNRATALEIVDTAVNKARVTLSGSGAIIKSLTPEQIKLRLDLQTARIGKNTFPISKDNLTLPPGLALRDVDPKSVEVTLDRPIEKAIPVQIDWSGRLPEHLILVEARTDPERILVLGGNTLLEKVSTLYTEKVPLEKIEKSGSVSASVVLSPASLKIAPGGKDRVKITYEIKERAR